MRLMAIGIDGLTPACIDQYRDAMPNVTALPERGGVHTQMVMTWPIWTSMATGLAPARHGVTTMWAEEEPYRAWQRDDVQAERFLFQLLNRYGYSVGWYRLPVTSYPPCALDGWMASGGAGSPTAIWPERLAEHYDPGPIYLPAPSSVPAGQESPSQIAALHEPLWASAKEALDAELASLLRLCEAAPVDVLFCYFNFPDAVQHHCFHRRDIMLDLHRWIDGAVGAITEAADADDVMVVSDHGMRAAVEGDYGVCRKGDTWFTRIQREGQVYFQSGMHLSPGVIRSTFAVDDELAPEDVFAIIALRCGIPAQELEGLDCDPGCCEPGLPANRAEQHLRGMGYA